jgi:Flp pilus assembly protein protease CpaA
MIFEVPGTGTVLPIAISILTIVWLSACAVFDLRAHQVPNGLTLPAIPLALLAAWLTWEGHAETMEGFLLHACLLILPLFVAWRNQLLGGADFKILVALSLTNPLLVLAAWIGVFVYYLGLITLQRDRPIRFTGCPGFVLGTGLFTLGQITVLITQRLVG